MTRRWSIAGGGLCALLSGCFGGNLTDPGPSAGRPGYMLIDSARGPGGLYGNLPPNALQARPQNFSGVGVRSGDAGAAMPVNAIAGSAPNARVVPASATTIQQIPAPAPDPVPQLAGIQSVGAAAEPRADQPVVGPDWEKARQALLVSQQTLAISAGVFPASPPAILATPVKPAGPSVADPVSVPTPAEGSSLKPSDPPGPLPILPGAEALQSALPAPAPQPVPVPPGPPTPTVKEPTPAVTPASAVSDSPLVLAVRAFQEKRHDEAVEYLKQYDAANQEVLLYLMPLMVRLGEGNLAAMSPDELAACVDRLQGATGVMRAKAALRLDTVCFCRQVFNYGKYVRLDPHSSVQPSETVNVYAEIHNFTWQPATGGQPQTPARGFVMHLAHTLEIRDAQNRVAWRTDPQPRDDVRQTPPTDYYLVYSFMVPETLPPGAYTLAVQVVDKPTGRLVRRAVEFQVGAR